MRGAWVIGMMMVMIGPAGGCAGGPRGGGPERGGESGTVSVVNAWCPVRTEDPVSATKEADEERVREWRGQRVGFCGSGCARAWDAMTDDQRSAALAGAIKREQMEGRPPSSR